MTATDRTSPFPDSLTAKEGGPEPCTGSDLRFSRLYISPERMCQRHLVQREDYYPALVSFAFRFGTDFRVIGQRHVDDSAFCRRHWLKAVFTPARCDPPCCAACESAQHLLAAFPVVLNVDSHVRLAAQLAARNHADEELERLECFTAPAYQQSCVLAFDFKHKRTVFVVVTDIRIGDNAHCTQEVVEEF